MNECGVELENPTGSGYNVSRIGLCPQIRACSVEGEAERNRKTQICN